jgi:predicted transcriptional regulator
MTGKQTVLHKNHSSYDLRRTSKIGKEIPHSVKIFGRNFGYYNNNIGQIPGT